MEQGVFLLPWDMEEDAEGFVRKLQALHCNTVAVNASYHHAGVADLRQQHMHYRYEAGTGFSVSPADYGRVCPLSQDTLEARYTRLREACTKNGLTLRAWIVNAHNSTLGARYPDLCVQNAWGDPVRNALCLNQPDFQAYVKNLIQNVENVISPDTYVMEAVAWLPAFHGGHHEFMLARQTPAVRYLLSLCFCGACRRRAQENGVDADAVRRLVQELLAKLLRQDTTYGTNEQTQLTHLFLEYPALYAYQRLRMQSVAELVEKTSRQIRSYGKKYEYIPNSTPFEINSTWYEACPFQMTEPFVDQYLPLIYRPEERYGTFLANVRLFNGTTPMGMCARLGRENYTGPEDFAARIREARTLGAQTVLCYNYGMATQEMLEWMRDAYAPGQEGAGGADR
jgi:hypothetical protein